MTNWRWCVVAGIAAFVCSVLFGQVPGLDACGPTGGLGPILAFEFVRSPTDVAALFGTEPCTTRFVAGQYLGLLLDGLVFIPAYTAFLVLAVAALTGGRMRVALATALIAAGLSDEIEGGLLYAILGDLPGTQPLIDDLWWAVHIKFALLALGSFAIGGLLVVTWRPVAVLAGVIVAGGAVKALHGLVTGPATMMAGFTIAWVTILLVALAGSVRPQLLNGRST